MLLFSKFTNIFEKGKIASNMLKKAIAEKRGSRVQWVECVFLFGSTSEVALKPYVLLFSFTPVRSAGGTFSGRIRRGVA